MYHYRNYIQKANIFAKWLCIFCLAGIIIFSGCDSRPIAERVIAVDFIVCKLANSERTFDVEILLRPQDDNGHTIKAPGILNVSMWTQDYHTSKKDELIHEWSEIQVTPESYEQNEGALIPLQHSKGSERYTGSYQPAIMAAGYAGYCQPLYLIAEDYTPNIEKYYSGYDVLYVTLEVTFTVNGKTLVFTRMGFDLGLTIEDTW